jgi:NAD(P)-dependent dehydrogenase (short-subunit alcohol dehydrogenase family)
METRQFENRTVVVTGAAKGIGAATARAFFREGARVALLDVDDAAVTVARDMNDRGKFVPCDVSKESEVRAAIASVVSAFGEVAVLVNNAGIQTYGTVTETTEELWDRTLNVNLKSAYLCAKHAIPSMQRRADGVGVVVNVSSVQAFLSQNNVAAYTTSKTALLGLTRSIAIDYAPKVRCVAVCPGTVDTPMLHWAIEQSPDPQEVLQECNDMHPVRRIAKPEEIADLILYLASDKAGFITGQPFRIDGGLGLSVAGSKRG